jgi:hypothetical protein
MVRNIFNKLFSKHEIKPPHEIEESFVSQFSDASSIEWSKHDNCYEVMFYCDDKEHIAKFGKDGKLTEHRINIKPAELPDAVLENAEKKGEIMSSIAVYDNLQLKEYELIFRDLEKTRFVMHQLPTGEITSISKL